MVDTGIMLEINCPYCRTPLVNSSAEKVVCFLCNRVYSQTLGIPDLRRPEMVSISDSPNNQENDTLIVQKLLEKYNELDYAGLLDLRLRNALTYNDLRGHEIAYMQSHVQRGHEMVEMFRRRLEEYFPGYGHDSALDVGCGTGASLLVLAGKFDQVVGVDPSLPELILAHKALETAGISNYQLVQAYGQDIPYSTCSFDYISALNVLEHVYQPDQVLGECFRILKQRGVFAADSRNRYDLFFQEPHVKLRWVGFLPRQWVKQYVYWRLRVGYEATWLLSYGDLEKALKIHFGKEYRIVFPYVSAYGASRRYDIWIRRLERIPLLSNFCLRIFPTHLALASRKEGM